MLLYIVQNIQNDRNHFGPVMLLFWLQKRLPVYVMKTIKTPCFEESLHITSQYSYHYMLSTMSEYIFLFQSRFIPYESQKNLKRLILLKTQLSEQTKVLITM